MSGSVGDMTVRAKSWFARNVAMCAQGVVAGAQTEENFGEMKVVEGGVGPRRLMRWAETAIVMDARFHRVAGSLGAREGFLDLGAVVCMDVRSGEW